MKTLLLLLFLISTISFAGQYYGQQPPEKIVEVSEELVIKKSETGICVAPHTTYYDTTKNYTKYKTLDECLKSGGSLPK